MMAAMQTAATTVAGLPGTDIHRSAAESTMLHVLSEPMQSSADEYWKHLLELTRLPDVSGEWIHSELQRRFADECWQHLREMIRLSDLSSELMPSEPQRRFADEYWKHLLEMIRLPDASSELTGTMLAEPTASSVSKLEGTSSSDEFSPEIVEFLEIAGGRNAGLRDALNDLDEAAAEAQDEKFPIPSDLALANARRLLLAMYKLLPRRFEVYPTPDGEVAIDAPGGRGRSVLLLCDSDGGALCLVNIDGKHRRARYSDTGSLPDGFVREALDEVAQRDELAA